MLGKRKSNFFNASQAVAASTLTFEQDLELFVSQFIKSVGNFGFEQVILPPVEEAKIFLKTPRLEKHFNGKLFKIPEAGKQELVLCPTHTFSIIRKYLETLKVRGPHVAKWFYFSPLLNLEDNKYVVSYELGIFVLGEDSHLANTQVINTVFEVFQQLGMPEFVVELNSLGCKSCQKDYENVLVDHLAKYSFDLCADCRESFEKDPFVVWNCENSICRQQLAAAPQIVDFLDESCKSVLMGILESIDDLSIPYILNPTLSLPLLREKVLFRVVASDAPGVVLGQGGNYTSLSRHLQEEDPVPVLGFLISPEKLLPHTSSEKVRAGIRDEVFIVSLGDIGTRRAMRLYRELKAAGITVAESMLSSAGIKNQFKEAASRHCELSLIIGQKEALEETVILRDMRSGMQEIFASDRIIEEIKKRLGKQ